MTESVLVTGAAGFIGYHLSERLLAEGHSVTGFDNLNPYYDPQLKRDRLARLCERPGFRFVEGDLADADDVEAAFALAEPAAVVNLAAQAGVRYSLDAPRTYLKSNVDGFLNVLEGCRAHPVRHLVYASSSSVYGANSKIPFAVGDEVERPVSLYAATKRANELMAATYAHLFGIPCTGLRFFTVYGPWGRPDMAYFSFTRKILAGEPIEVFNHGQMRRDFTYIDDIVEGLVRVLGKPPTGEPPVALHNIGNHSPVALGEFIETLEGALGRPAEKRYLPMQAGDVPETYADVRSLTEAVGFQPSTPLAAGLARFVEWYRTYYGV